MATCPDCGHPAACANCMEPPLPAAPTGEGHFDVRFPSTVLLAGRCVVTLDGEDITSLTFAGMAGEAGWVAMYNTAAGIAPRHVCRSCGYGVCSRVVAGDVQIRSLAAVGE